MIRKINDQHFVKIGKNRRLITNGNKLKLDALISNDTGYYECSLPYDDTKIDVINLVVFSNSSNEFKLQTSVLKRQIEAKNQAIFQICKSSASGLSDSNRLKIIWYDSMGKAIRNKSESRINTILLRENPVTKVSILRLANVTSLGIYSCVATAGLKSDTVDFELVKPREKNSTKELVQFLLNEEIVREKQDFELKCPGSMSTNETFEWSYNENTNFESNDIDTYQDRLLVYYASFTLNGYFTCRYTNPYYIYEYYIPIRVIRNMQPMFFAKIEVN